MRIAVLGSKGLLGSTLVPHLRTRGHEVLCPTRNGQKATHGDLTNENCVNKVLDELLPEVIVNLAALTNVDECERNPQAAYLANVHIVENLTKWIQRRKNKYHLVQISTDQLYDGRGPHRESDITLRNYYGFSKYAGELAAINVSSTVVRTNFFGRSQCPGRTSLSDWLVQSLSKGDTITVFDDVRFSPLSLQKLAQLLELVTVKRLRGIFNVGSKEGMSKGDFAFALANALNLTTQNITRGSSHNVRHFAYRPKDMCMDSSHFEETFEVELPTLQEEIQSMKGYYWNEIRKPLPHCWEEDRP